MAGTSSVDPVVDRPRDVEASVRPLSDRANGAGRDLRRRIAACGSTKFSSAVALLETLCRPLPQMRAVRIEWPMHNAAAMPATEGGGGGSDRGGSGTSGCEVHGREGTVRSLKRCARLRARARARPRPRHNSEIY